MEKRTLMFLALTLSILTSHFGSALRRRKRRIQSHQEDDLEDEFRYKVDLDTRGQLRLLWDISPVVEKIVFRLEAKLSRDDLLIFGFSDYGESTDADVVVMWTDLYGRHVFQDGNTDKEGRLHIDKNQDYTLDDVTETPDGVALTFHRLYDTCDDDDYMIDGGTTHMVFATAGGPLPAVRGLNVSRLDPGVQRVQLLKSQLPDPLFPPDTRTFTMHVDNVAVPEFETTYWCAVKKLPSMREKYHIIQTEGAIAPAGEGIVHHLEVFHCEVAPGESIKSYNGPCRSGRGTDNRPEGLEPCRKVIGAWAMGAEALTYPDEAGYPIGGPDFSRYVMIEVHYNNPEHAKGIVDSSGLRFSVTKTLRQYDAGVMELGLEYTDKMALPPGQEEWDLNGYCPPECTAVGLPEGGIEIFASQLHTHLTGRRVYTNHYRDGVELPELNRDNHYSPHYQEIRRLKRPVRVMPGDSLVTTCKDYTADQENVTLGGFSISDEMCVNYVHYYPKSELELCKSSVTTRSLYGFFRFLNEYQGEATSPLMGINANYHAINWTPLNVDLLRTYYDNGPISMQCNQSDGRRFPGEWEGLSIPKVLYPLPPTGRPCLE